MNINELIDAIALDDNRDPYAELDKLANELSPHDFARYCDAFDICREHHCDIEICIDDEADCQESVVEVTF